MQLPDTLPRLSAGGHEPYEGEMCAMEAASWLAGEAWGARPVCVDQSLGSMLIHLNDMAPTDEQRATLWPLIIRVIGTSLPFFERMRWPQTAGAFMQANPVFVAQPWEVHRDQFIRVLDLFDALYGRRGVAPLPSAMVELSNQYGTVAAA